MAAGEVNDRPPRPGSRPAAAFLASASFVVLVAGMTYFAILVLTVRLSDGENRAAAYRELGQFLSGQLDWYQDARVYGAASLVLALLSLLLGVNRLARVTVVVSGLVYALLAVYQQEILDLLQRWAQAS